MQHFDIAIVGAGMVGLALANALAKTNVKIALVSRQPLSSPLTEAPELRVSAINLANRKQFQALGIWQNIALDRQCDYQHMQVWDQDSFGAIEFNASELQLEQLGCIVENQALTNALAENVKTQSNVTVFEAKSIQQLSLGDAQHAIQFDDGGLLTCSLVVGADGANSLVRRTCQFPMNTGEYGQTAIVATIKTSIPHGGVARQVFTPFGPLALLPLADENLCSIVWSQDSAQTGLLLALPEQEFNKQLTVVSNHSLGLLSLASETKSFLLTKQYARQWVGEGVVLCGDAAHTLHPLAGQGANLGFEDAWCLAKSIQEIAEKSGVERDFRKLANYRAYERQRKTAAVAMLGAMETFHQLFTGNNSLKKGIRGLALRAANTFTPLKHTLVKQALGL